MGSGGGKSSRLTSVARYLTLSFVAGFALVLTVQLSNLLTLLGDPRQAYIVLAGVMSGGFIFPLLGPVFLRRTPRPFLSAAAFSILIIALLWFWNTYYQVAPDSNLFVRSFLCATGTSFISVVFVCDKESTTKMRSLMLRALALGVVPAVMAITYAELYVDSSFTDFPSLILWTEALVGVVILVAWTLTYVASQGTRQPEKTPEASADEEDEKVRSSTDNISSRAQALQRTLSYLRVGRVAKGSSAIALLLVAAMCLPAIAPAAEASSSPLTTAYPLSSPHSKATPIEHVIEIMMENHAFDNAFGDYPRGFSSSNITANITQPEDLLNISGAWPVTPISNGTFFTTDPIEGYTAYHVDWDGGRMDDFVQGSGSQSMQYYTSAQMAPQWDWAQEFSLADHYFSSMLTETNPNRLYATAGYSPVINDYGPSPYVPFSETIFGELQTYGVSWGYYNNDPSQGLGQLDYIEGLPFPSASVGDYQDFLSQLSAGTLPSVSFLEPIDGGVGDNYDEEPPESVLSGEMWLLYFIDAIMDSPEWNSTAIFLTYDEAGGYYDQVDPPVLDGVQLGERIPMWMISPYSKEDYVSHTVLNHCSILAFIDYNWELPPLNKFVADSNVPIDMFDFSSPYPGGTIARAPLPFTSAEGFPVPSAWPFPANSGHGPNLANLYPQPWQIPPDKLPYGTQGSSSFTLASEGKSPFISQDVSWTPYYYTPEALGAIGAVELIATAIVLGKIPVRRKR